MATRLNARLGLSVGTTPTNVIDANGSITANSITVANTFAIGANVNANTTGLYVGNSTVYATTVATQISVANSSYGFYATPGNIAVMNGSIGQVLIGNDNLNGSIEIGQSGRSTSGTPYIDFHSAVGSTDYDVRIIASGGNTTNGSGNLQIVANTLNISNTVITGTANATVAFNVGANVVANTTTFYVGNSTVYAYTNSTAQYLVGTGGVLSAPTIVANNQFQIQDSAGATVLRLVGSGASAFIQAGSNSTNTTAEIVLARTTTLNSTVANVKVFAVSTMFAGGNVSITSGASSVVPDATLSVTGTANVSGNVALTSATASGNNVSGALIVAGGIGVGDSVYVKNRVGFTNSTNVSTVYQYYNAATNSLDTVFG